MQVKNLYVGKDHVGDVPLIKKIAAGLTTGRKLCQDLYLRSVMQYLKNMFMILYKLHRLLVCVHSFLLTHYLLTSLSTIKNTCWIGLVLQAEAEDYLILGVMLQAP